MNIELARAKINYEMIGKGLPIIILHGFGVDHVLMKSCLDPIFTKKSNYKCIYIDLPGMGKSNVKDIHNADHMLECLIEFIDQVIDNEKFLIVGESYGGYLSLGILNYYKNRVLGSCFICPCIQPDFSKRSLPQTQTFIKSDEFVDIANSNILKTYYETAVVISKETYIEFTESIYPSFSLANNYFLEIYQKNGYSFKSFSMKEYNQPSCFFVGKQDQFVGYKDSFDYLEYFSRASMFILDMAGHNLQIEQPKLFEIGVVDWLTRVDINTLNQ